MNYFVIFDIRDGDSSYEQYSLISIDIDPNEKAFILEEYGNIPYCSLNDSYDLGYGNGYPLVRVGSWKEIKPEHLQTLKTYFQ